jgi:hypothetical protein
MNTTPEIEPQLMPPGAGLPLVELTVARMRFAWRRFTGDQAAFTAHFAKERSRIRTLLHGLATDAASRRVLIERPRGLEDSSRYWSVWMTLDHLRMVHRGIVRVIGALAKGVTPPGRASTAAVKPSPDVTADVVGAYEASCDDLVAAVQTAGNLKTRLRYAHPWFGPLDAAGWHALAAGHMTIHRVQIQRILQGAGCSTIANGRE